jgi:hypothetical protein
VLSKTIIRSQGLAFPLWPTPTGHHWLSAKWKTTSSRRIRKLRWLSSGVRWIYFVSSWDEVRPQWCRWDICWIITIINDSLSQYSSAFACQRPRGSPHGRVWLSYWFEFSLSKVHPSVPAFTDSFTLWLDPNWSTLSSCQRQKLQIFLFTWCRYCSDKGLSVSRSLLKDYILLHQ